MTLSIAIFIAQRGRDKREDLFRINKRRNTRTLRSFFSFGVSFGLPFFLTFATVDLDDSGARDVSANVGVSINAVAFVASSSFAAASACACSAAEMAARASSSAQSIFFSVITKEHSVNKIERDAPARRFARVYDASVGACNYESVDNKERSEKEKKPLNRNALLTSGHSTVSAFMFMT